MNDFHLDFAIVVLRVHDDRAWILLADQTLQDSLDIGRKVILVIVIILHVQDHLDDRSRFQEINVGLLFNVSRLGLSFDDIERLHSGPLKLVDVVYFPCGILACLESCLYSLWKCLICNLAFGHAPCAGAVEPYGIVIFQVRGTRCQAIEFGYGVAVL